MVLDGTFPGRDLDEILNSMEELDGLDEKIQYIQENFSMDEMKKLEDDGSEIAEEALIQTARENASDEEAAEFISDGFNDKWRENPHEGLATIEKAVDRHPEKPDPINSIGGHKQKVNIFRNLLKEGHVVTAKQFSELVEGVEEPSWDREEEDEDLTSEEIAKEVYAELEDNRSLADADYLEKMVKIAEIFEVRDWTVGNRKEDLVEEYEDDGEYEKALRSANRFEVQSLGDNRDIQDVASEGYEDRMDQGEYLEAARIARKAGGMFEGFDTDKYLEKEKEAAKEAFKKNLDEGDYGQAKRVLNRFKTEGEEENIQTYLIKKMTNEEINQEQYQELTEEIGYDPRQRTTSPQEQEANSEAQKEYNQEEELVEEEEQGYLSRLNPFA